MHRLTRPEQRTPLAHSPLAATPQERWTARLEELERSGALEEWRRAHASAPPYATSPHQWPPIRYPARSLKEHRAEVRAARQSQQSQQAQQQAQRADDKGKAPIYP